MASRDNCRGQFAGQPGWRKARNRLGRALLRWTADDLTREASLGRNTPPVSLETASASSIACSPALRSPALAQASASSLRNIGAQALHGLVQTHEIDTPVLEPAQRRLQPAHRAAQRFIGMRSRVIDDAMQRKDGAPTPVSERKRAAHSGHASNHREGFLDEWPNCHAAPPGRVTWRGCKRPISHARTPRRAGGCSSTYLELRPFVEFSFL
jgi:hypothetical protein